MARDGGAVDVMAHRTPPSASDAAARVVPVVTTSSTSTAPQGGEPRATNDGTPHSRPSGPARRCTHHGGAKRRATGTWVIRPKAVANSRAGSTPVSPPASSRPRNRDESVRTGGEDESHDGGQDVGSCHHCPVLQQMDQVASETAMDGCTHNLHPRWQPYPTSVGQAGGAAGAKRRSGGPADEAWHATTVLRG